MNEEEKQALTGLCKIEIKRWKAASESNPNMRYMVELMELALAALTAQPDDWKRRAEAAEAKLADLAKQKPVAYEVQLCWDKNGIEKSGTIEFRKTPPSPDESHGLKILPLFTRPAPAADLAELVPSEITHADAPELQEIASSARAIGVKGIYAGFAVGANWMRAAILSNIEELSRGK